MGELNRGELIEKSEQDAVGFLGHQLTLQVECLFFYSLGRSLKALFYYTLKWNLDLGTPASWIIEVRCVIKRRK